MTKPLSELMGRRFEFSDGSGPDLTLVSGDYETKMVTLHLQGGGRQTLPMRVFKQAVTQGALIESEKVGFVNEPQRAETAHRKPAKQPREYLGDKER